MQTKTLNESFDRMYEGIGSDDFRSLSESRLDEKIPKDLAKSYKRADNSPFDSYEPTSTRKQPDFEAAEYTEITPEEALAYKKSGNVANLRMLVNGNLVRFNSDGTVANRAELGWAAKDKIYTNRNGKRVHDTKYMPFSHIVKIADKIYYTDELDTEISPEKMARRDDSDRRFANLNLGAVRTGYGSPSRAKRDMRVYDKYLTQSQDKLRKLEAEWEAGTISRNDYEKRKANIEDSIRYDKRNLYKAIGQRADRRAAVRNFVGNRETQSTLDKFKELKNDLKWANRDLSNADQKYTSMKTSGAQSSTYAYDRKTLDDLKRKLSIIQRDIEYYEKKLSDDSVSADTAKAEAQYKSALNRVASIQNEISAMLGRNKPVEEAVSTDLSKVEGSMTKIIQDNMKMIDRANSPAQMADILKNIFLEHDLKTKASERLLLNIRKSRNLEQAQMTLYNSLLAGSGLSVIKNESKSIKESARDNPPVKSIKELAARGFDPDGDYYYNVYPKDGVGAIVPEDNVIENIDSRYVYVEGYGVQGNPDFKMTLRIPVDQFDKYYNFTAID